MKLLKLVKCLFGYHESYTAFSWKTGAYQISCPVCGKIMSKGGRS